MIRPPLEAGDPAPRIVALDEEGQPAFSHADALAGRPLILLFCAARGEVLPEQFLVAFRERSIALAELQATLFGLSRLPAPTNLAVHRSLRLPFKLLADATGAVFRGYGVDAATVDPTTVVIVDPDHRVAAILRDGDAERLAEMTVGNLRRLFVPRGARVGTQAPVLLLPRVLSEGDCARLIDLWHRPANVWQSADGFTSDGHRLEKGDFKVDHAGGYGHMTEYVVRDPGVQGFLDLRFNRRVAPELHKAFQTSVAQREDYRIVRYDAAGGGVLRPHRDNPTKETAHRRFTMTINLNAGDYDGGALRFREYGDHFYEVERGTAVVWSAALLHEVTPVTRGARFVLGVHMYGGA